MATDEEAPRSPEALSSDEARRRLMRLIVRQDMDAHPDIYDELARE